MFQNVPLSLAAWERCTPPPPRSQHGMSHHSMNNDLLMTVGSRTSIVIHLLSFIFSMVTD